MTDISALVCINGECDQQVLSRLNTVDFNLLVAVDGGLRHIHALGGSPDWLIGDMDSVNQSALSSLSCDGTRLIKHPVEKDATDLELALQHLADAGVAEITLIGIGGGRLDHSLANLLLLGQSDWPFSIRFLSSDGNGFLITAQRPFESELPIDSELSLLPLTADVAGVSCTGLYYPLSDATICLGSTLGISNIVVDQTVSVTLTAGRLLLLHNESTHPAR